MGVSEYQWPAVSQFLNRTDDLLHLDEWWDSTRWEPITLIGRRRVGKSWLFRRFAHGKPSLILVSEELPAGAQLARFADQLEPVLGVRPDLPDVPALVEVLFQAARSQQLLVVIDEFPLLLGTSAPERQRTLTSIQAVIEHERDSSKLRLLLCGSHVAVMDSLFTERSPLHGRLRRFDVRPLPFRDATAFLNHLDPIEAFERFAVAGGMPMYLSRLAAGPLRSAVCNAVLDPDAPLWNEGRTLLDQELREPRVYFGILSRLATGPKELNEITQPLRLDSSRVSRYLQMLVELRLVSRSVPLGSDLSSRSGHWQLEDPFLRFWFRFVFPFQSDLESGLAPATLFDQEVAPAIAEHVSPVFEAWCREWLRRTSELGATQVGSWWGPAVDGFRRSGERTSEEIDAVGLTRGRVVVVAEAKWTKRQLTPAIVQALDRYKIPALRQSGLKVAADLSIVLFSKSGYSDALRLLAEQDARIKLVDVPQELAGHL